MVQESILCKENRSFDIYFANPVFQAVNPSKSSGDTIISRPAAFGVLKILFFQRGEVQTRCGMLRVHVAVAVAVAF